MNYWNEVMDGIYTFDDAYVGPIDIPQGVINCDEMFAHCQIKEGCYLRNFDTHAVVSMARMFYDATIPKGFSLGDKFDTSNVERMQMMFADARVPDDFVLGDNFSIKSRCNITDMFKGCNKFNLTTQCTTFDPISYLKTMCGSDYDKLPQDEVAMCRSDIDCDDLYERWLFNAD